MTEKLRKCPFCGGVGTLRTVINENFIECRKCYARSGSPLGFNISKEQAIKLWNTRAADENPPLTLDELKRMNGEPVWVETMQEWRTVYIGVEKDIRLYSIFNTISAKHVLDNNGLVYRRKPEEAN